MGSTLDAQHRGQDGRWRHGRRRHRGDPERGPTLEAVLTDLVATYGWPGLAERITLRCFTHEPRRGNPV